MQPLIAAFISNHREKMVQMDMDSQDPKDRRYKENYVTKICSQISNLCDSTIHSMVLIHQTQHIVF